MRSKPPARNNKEVPNIFGATSNKPTVRDKQGRIRNVMRVGGRKISAAPVNKIKYKFPVILTKISEAQKCGGK